MTKTASEERTALGAPTWLAWLLIVTGVVGLIGSFALSVERIHMLQNPDDSLSCDINPFLTCSATMAADQGEAFGFPNPFIGLMGFAAPIAVGVALLAGAKFAKWFWAAFTVGVIGALAFVLWLGWNSVFFLGVVCPWCFVVWVTTYAMVFPLIAHAIAIEALPFGKAAARFAKKYRSMAWLVSFLVLIAVVLTVAVRLPNLIRLLFVI